MRGSAPHPGPLSEDWQGRQVRVRGGFLAGRAPEAYQEPPGAAKAKRKRHDVSLGGPWRTLVRQSCPTDEEPTPLAGTCGAEP